jgi:hypothetical protein
VISQPDQENRSKGQLEIRQLLSNSRRNLEIINQVVNAQEIEKIQEKEYIAEQDL